MALPVFSFDTEEQARMAQVTFGKLGYDGIYRWTSFDGELESLDGVSNTLRSWYDKHMKQEKKPRGS